MIGVELISPSSVRQAIDVGMYVRFAVEEDRQDNEFRDFRIGRIASIDDLAEIAIIAVVMQEPGAPAISEEHEYPLAHVERCRVLPGTPFSHVTGSQHGVVLAPCYDGWEQGQLREYYVEVDGAIGRVTEDCLVIASTRQDPEPLDQLRRYEFQHPMWKNDRDDIVLSYHELRHATFGVEDLVGSRIMLLAHQAETIATVLSDPKCRYILADEVGLGKTIEACVILKGLRRRQPGLRTLIITPPALVQQWHNELNDKFWLNFSLAHSSIPDQVQIPPVCDCDPGGPGVLVATDDLATDATLWAHIWAQHWDLLIVDEAHQLSKSPTLYARVRELSRRTARVLLLSATPIQRRATEYLALLAVLDPERYDPADRVRFEQVLALQERLRRTVAYLTPGLTRATFDAEEFEDEFAAIVEDLEHDATLAALAARVPLATRAPDGGLQAAQTAIAYVCENYRIEHRVIRNRRAHLQVSLPNRALDTHWCYDPEADELAVLDLLSEYLEHQLTHDDPALQSEFRRIFLHAAASSAHALLELVEARQAVVLDPEIVPSDTLSDLLTQASPRAEPARLYAVLSAIPVSPGEQEFLERLTWAVRRWRDATEHALDRTAERWPAPSADHDHRLIRTLYAIQQVLQQPGSKVLLFSSWPQTIAALLPRLTKLFRRDMIAQFTTGVDAEQLVRDADRFQSDDACRILVADELGGEGRNFQSASAIIHLDLPWTPAQLEQRIGRVDRFGRVGTVLSIVPFGNGTLEQDLFRLWQDAFSLFTQSMSGLEIALESVQDDIRQALGSSLRHGLARLYDRMVQLTAQLREEVEEERYFEEGALNQRRRREFSAVSERYRNGELLRAPFLRWANLAGLRNSFNPSSGIALFNPRDFSLKSMANAKVFNLPNMEDALTRSGRTRNLVIRGTFDRDLAVRREDLVFFAPGSDPWTDALVANALEGDRGRCCAVLRKAAGLGHNWFGLEFRYSLSLDPRPLFAAGFQPTHLFHAQGFLNIPMHRILVSTEGTVLSPTDPIYALTQRPFDKAIDQHLGKRDGQQAWLPQFKRLYHSEIWPEYIDRMQAAATAALEEDFDFTSDLATEAQEQFAQRAAGWRAARQWLLGADEATVDHATIAEYERVTEALVEGLRRPEKRLESLCFWIIQDTAGQ